VRVFGVVGRDPVGEEHLVAGAAVEGLGEGVLPGEAGLDIGGGGGVETAPVAQGVGDRLGALSQAVIGRATSPAGAPNQLWVADLTYVAAWEATAYVAFVIDVFSRRIAIAAAYWHRLGLKP